MFGGFVFIEGEIYPLVFESRFQQIVVFAVFFPGVFDELFIFQLCRFIFRLILPAFLSVINRGSFFLFIQNNGKIIQIAVFPEIFPGLLFMFFRVFQTVFFQHFLKSGVEFFVIIRLFVFVSHGFKLRFI